MKGFLSLDVDVSKLEINQCEADIYYPSSSEISIFHGSHKCHNRTSKVITKFQIFFSSTLVNCPFLNLFCVGTVFFLILQCIYKQSISHTSWTRGSYQCLCRDGYYSPHHGGKFNGTLVEGIFTIVPIRENTYINLYFSCLA